MTHTHTHNGDEIWHMDECAKFHLHLWKVAPVRQKT